MMNSLKFVLVLLLIILLNIFLDRSVHAAITFSISEPILNNDDEIEVTATLSGLISSSCSTSGCYLQAELQSAGGYFGYTLNNSGEYVDYFKSPLSIDEIKTKLFNIIPVSGYWTGKLKAKNNPLSKNYYGPGDYLLTFRRFSGNSLTPTSGDSNSIPIPLSLAVIIPSPSGNDSEIKTPDPTSTPTSSPFVLKTQAPQTSIGATPIISIKPSPTKSSVIAQIPQISSESGEKKFVLGTDSGNLISSDSPNIQRDNKKIPILAFILVILGICFIAFPIFSIIKKGKKEYTDGSAKKDTKIL